MSSQVYKWEWDFICLTSNSIPWHQAILFAIWVWCQAKPDELTKLYRILHIVFTVHEWLKMIQNEFIQPTQCALLGDSKGRPWKVTFPFSLLVGRFFLLKRLFSLSPLFSFQSLTRFFYLKRTSFRSLFCPVYLNDDRLRNKKFAICSKPLKLDVYQEISTAHNVDL